MKKLLLFLGLLIGFNTSVIGQNVKMTESELETTLTNQWEIEFATMGSEKIGQMPGAKDFDFLFTKDGKFDLIEDDGTIRKGFWKYLPDENYIELTIDGKITSRITSLNKSKLILILVSDKSSPSKLTNVEIHFKPI
jgi:hypothetical protein